MSRCGHVSVTNCRLDVTSNMKKRCEGLNHCSLKASNSFGSDPCGGVSKYLEIDYLCKEGECLSLSGLRSEIGSLPDQNAVL